MKCIGAQAHEFGLYTVLVAFNHCCDLRRMKEKQHYQVFLVFLTIPWKKSNTFSKNTILVIT